MPEFQCLTQKGRRLNLTNTFVSQIFFGSNGTTDQFRILSILKIMLLKLCLSLPVSSNYQGVESSLWMPSKD